MSATYQASYLPGQWPVAEPDRKAVLSSNDRLWVCLILGVTLGYLTMGRSFAYFGIIPLKLFVGEIVLGAFLLTRFKELVGRWIESLFRAGVLSSYSIALLLLLLYGLAQVVRGYVEGYPVLRALQNVVLNYYPFYLFLGIWVGRTRPDALAKFIPVAAFVHGVYSLATMFGLERVPIKLAPEVPLFGEPAGAGVMVLGLLCFPPKSRLAFWGLLLLNLLALVGVQVRAQWIAFAVAVMVWAIASRRVGSVYAAAVACALFLGVGAALDMELPGLQSRGGNVTIRSMVARLVAPINEELAVDLAGPGMRGTKGTFEWRVKWWKGIWNNLRWEDPSLQLFGFGYGYPLFKLHPQLQEEEHEIRTPHNIFFYCLGYCGWVGVFLFYFFQVQLLRLQWRAASTRGVMFGLLVWIYMIIQAHFGNIFESPFGSIPTYVLLGISCAPLVVQEDGDAR